PPHAGDDNVVGEPTSTKERMTQRVRVSHAANLDVGGSQAQQVIHPDDLVRGTLSICRRGACTYLQQIPSIDWWALIGDIRQHDRESFAAHPAGTARGAAQKHPSAT